MVRATSAWFLAELAGVARLGGEMSEIAVARWQAGWRSRRVTLGHWFAVQHLGERIRRGPVQREAGVTR